MGVWPPIKVQKLLSAYPRPDVVFEVTELLVPRTHPQSDWSAHLVLARGRSPKDLLAPLDASWTVTSVSLAQSVRTPGGPGYEDVAVFSLGR